MIFDRGDLSPLCPLRAGVYIDLLGRGFPRKLAEIERTVKCERRDTAETEFCGAKINSVFACQFVANGRPGNT